MLKHHQLGLENHFSSWPIECIIIYAKPWLAEGWLYEQRSSLLPPLSCNDKTLCFTIF